MKIYTDGLVQSRSSLLDGKAGQPEKTFRDNLHDINYNQQ